MVQDLKQVLNEITPPDRPYRHHLRWGDDNGHSHLRAALIGPSGKVLWYKPKADGTSDLRDVDSSRKFMDDIFADLPGAKR